MRISSIKRWKKQKKPSGCHWSSSPSTRGRCSGRCATSAAPAAAPAGKGKPSVDDLLKKYGGG
jgi:hypothetical protein